MESIRSFFAYFMTQAPYDTVLVRIGLWGSVILLVIGLIGAVVLMWRRDDKAYLSYVPSLLAGARWFGLAFLVLFFLRYEGIRPFTLRVWVYGVGIALLVWARKQFAQAKRVAPVAKQQSQLHERYGKYLPR